MSLRAAIEKQLNAKHVADTAPGEAVYEITPRLDDAEAAALCRVRNRFAGHTVRGIMIQQEAGRSVLTVTYPPRPAKQ